MRTTASIACLIALLCTLTSAAHADTPAAAVFSHPIAQGQSYPGVNANSEGWFDVGGFCKVVDVGDLSSIAPGAHGVPVFVPGPLQQWENYRTSASAHYNGQLTLTTCCRPQVNIATLCTEAGATPISVSREYGKLSETDTLSAVCLDQWGKTYTDTVSLTCVGDNGPDGQAAWIGTGPDVPSACTPNAFTSACTESCGGGTATTYDSCGNVQAVSVCNTQPCCTNNYVKSCSGDLATFTDFGTCHDPSFSIQGGCTAVQSGCSASCQLNSHTTTIFSGDPSLGVFCDTNYEDCASWTSNETGTKSDCTTGYEDAPYSEECSDGTGHSGTNNVPTSESCTCTNYK